MSSVQNADPSACPKLFERFGLPKIRSTGRFDPTGLFEVQALSPPTDLLPTCIHHLPDLSNPAKSRHPDGKHLAPPSAPLGPGRHRIACRHMRCWLPPLGGERISKGRKRRLRGHRHYEVPSRRPMDLRRSNGWIRDVCLHTPSRWTERVLRLSSEEMKGLGSDTNLTLPERGIATSCGLESVPRFPVGTEARRENPAPISERATHSVMSPRAWVLPWFSLPILSAAHEARRASTLAGMATGKRTAVRAKACKSTILRQQVWT
jgi:hypothetical protein